MTEEEVGKVPRILSRKSWTKLQVHKQTTSLTHHSAHHVCCTEGKCMHRNKHLLRTAGTQFSCPSSHSVNPNQNCKKYPPKALPLWNCGHQKSFLTKVSKTKQPQSFSSLTGTWKTWGSDYCLAMLYLNLSKAVPWVQDCYGRNCSTAPARRGLRWSPSQPTGQAGSALNSDQVTQDFIQSSLKIFEGDCAVPPGSLLQRPATVPTTKQLFLTSVNLSHFSWCPFSLILLSYSAVKSLPIFSTLFCKPSHQNIQTLEKED